jgi:hypothetical protein
LVESLKEFVFLDIYGQVDEKKIKPYRTMVQAQFPNTRLHIETLRFRLWL